MELLSKFIIFLFPRNYRIPWSVYRKEESAKNTILLRELRMIKISIHNKFPCKYGGVKINEKNRKSASLTRPPRVL